MHQDSSVCTIEISMCNIIFNIIFWIFWQTWCCFKMSFLSKTCNNFCKINDIIVSSQLCYYTSIYLIWVIHVHNEWTYSICLIKKKKYEKEILWQEKILFGDEWLLSNQHYQEVPMDKTDVLFCPIQRKVAQLASWLLLEKLRYHRIATINDIQNLRLHLWHWYLSCCNYFYLQTRTLSLCTFFSRL